MNRTELLQRIRTMQFERIYRRWKIERIYRRWKNKEMRQTDAVGMLNMSERTFHRYVVRYEKDSTKGLLDKRIERHSPGGHPLRKYKR